MLYYVCYVYWTGTDIPGIVAASINWTRLYSKSNCHHDIVGELIKMMFMYSKYNEDNMKNGGQISHYHTLRVAVCKER